jgi:hypothetical protein
MTMTMTPTEVAAGHDVTVSSITPCNPGESVAVLLNAPPNTTEADTTADGAGAWTVTFTVPLTVPPGTYGVQAACSPLGAFREYDPLGLTVKLAVTLRGYPIFSGKGGAKNLRANLTTTADGRPVVDATITFTNLKHTVLCAAQTDSAGTATCTTGGYRAITSGGYYAIYAGDATHLAVTVKGHTVATSF